MVEIKLISSNNVSFNVEKNIIEKSVLIKNMLEDIGEDEAPIPLPNVNDKILEKIIEWCKYHKDDPILEEDSDDIYKNLKIDNWDKNFFDVDQETLFDIILAANYMDIKYLLNIGCKIIADMIKGKSVEEIRKIFNIVNDFTPEEEAQIRKENEWAEDK